MTSSEVGGVGLRFSLEKHDTTNPMDQKLFVRFDYRGFDYSRINRFFMRIPAQADEVIYGGGEQFSFFNLRERGRYPIWVSRQKS